MGDSDDDIQEIEAPTITTKEKKGKGKEATSELMNPADLVSYFRFFRFFRSLIDVCRIGGFGPEP